MDSATINARFGTQEQAESAVRKLRALRGDCFRIECESVQAAPSGLADTHVEFAAENGFLPTLADQTDPRLKLSFTLSAQLPVQVAEQARSVIFDAGGRLM